MLCILSRLVFLLPDILIKSTIAVANTYTSVNITLFKVTKSQNNSVLRALNIRGHFLSNDTTHVNYG